MGRLHCVLLLTPEPDRQRAFYAERLGLELARAADSSAVFATRGAALVVKPQAAGRPPELGLAITATPLEAKLQAAVARGAKAEGEIVATERFRLAALRDPEGNLVQLIEPSAELPVGRWPRLSRAIVSAADFDAAVAFYREVLGLRIAERAEHRVEFDTGETRLTVQDREHAASLALFPDQRVAIAFEDEDFDAWTEELRGRGVTFAATPAETDLGLSAEVEDADGWCVVLHGLPVEDPLDEDALEDEYGADEDDDDGALPRRGGELAGGGTARRSLPAAKLARKQAARTAERPGPEADRGGFVPRGPMGPRPPRPFTPRPASAEGGAPRPYTPRPFTPREGGPPRPAGPRPSGPRPGGPGSGPGGGPGRGPRRPDAPGRPDRER